MKRLPRRSLKRQAIIAFMIADRLSRPHSPQQPELPDPELALKLQDIQKKATRAESLGLRLARERLDRTKLQLLKRMRDQINTCVLSLDDQTIGEVDCNSKSIVTELAAIEVEFGGIDIDLRHQIVSVLTPEIQLDGVLLGRFQICLDTRYLGNSRPYRIIAVDPECARDCDETTHPHVQSEQLCEGEGSGPIKHALADGRLFDFFTIVRQILQTYNPDSAYTRLSDWYGIECSDCGATVDRDDSDTCERCDSRSCSECSTCCSDCDRTVCGNCTGGCESCGQRFCDACLSECRDCGESFCDDCLTKGLCDDCGERVSETEAETQKANTEAAAV